MSLSSWTREPLMQFVALGAILYLLLTWGGTPPDPASRVIKVGDSERESIAESWALTMGRAPTDAELDQAVETFVREEILYREALRLGLDEGDAIVRRRLVSKMDLSASLAAETVQPSDTVLRAYWNANAERYSELTATNPTVTFEQALFTSEAAALAALQMDQVRGESTSLPGRVTAKSLREVEAQFGQQFADGLIALVPTSRWQGPLTSGFGWHLIRLRNRSIPPPDFDHLRTVVANDWRNEEIAARKARAFEVLASAYRIER